jgi:drug/metabolite transporter (DMT)-like permease
LPRGLSLGLWPTDPYWNRLSGWALLLPFFLGGAGWREYPAITAAGWGSILFLGIACSGIAYFLWCAALGRLEASRVASFLYIEPLVTQAAAALYLDEGVHAVQVAGGILVLGAVVLVERAPGDKRT